VHPSPVLDALSRVPLFSDLPEEKLAWISERGQEIRLEPGTRIANQGDPPDGLYVVLEGQTEWKRKVGGQEVFVVTLGEGSIFAELILILDAPYPTTGHAVTPVRLFKLGVPSFWEMLRTCPQVLRGILATSVQRAELHESVSQQHAKLISLGTMAAGLAHELNNPAAAVGRSARSDREDEMALWLEERGFEAAWELSPTLAAAALDTERLQRLAGDLNDDNSLNGALEWLGATLELAGLAEEVGRSAGRISELVGAMKEHTYMDRGSYAETDVREGLESTLTILGHKLKGATIEREYQEDLPKIWANAGELNQVWTNLLDNAADAVGGRGRIAVRAYRVGDAVAVEITDDGPGIQREIQNHIFEPFFTSKEIGEGTGLGLDTVRRIVAGHDGEITFESEPGETRFTVRLPAEKRNTEGG
jgi:signal transduction histidine kinase